MYQDFDFGEQRLIELSHKLNFPWLLSNAYHTPLLSEKKRLLGSAEEYIVRQLENGLRVGFIGLAGTYVASLRYLLHTVQKHLSQVPG